MGATVKKSNIDVKFIDVMGNDLRVVNSARISFGKEKEILDEKDEKLIKYLAKHYHFTPFEHCQATMLIKCPLFIRSQIMRHRTFSYNEISRRYTEENIEFYEPQNYRTQHQSSKQCSADELEGLENVAARTITKLTHEYCLEQYRLLVKAGVAREMARGILPQNVMTEFYMSGNLRNWMHFLKLRLDNHAQLESQLVAIKVASFLREKFPISFRYLMEYI